ncbi:MULTISPECIES: DUF5692 family protein [unclassified Novosphingobium]|uniref:DUF5692 family protein n=1 Tax=unclassified Novosphingobium TaxID=2644732 RepID=UPI00146B13E7|nr:MULTISPECIES: DUF5692 family protein [unclassified Novosphingobium]NMN06828.1 hypothetical protein [Novosphingobium sp. SG919]NMN88722.1 hypothetical protein [Novosphingobium sp. SG916]
MTRTVAMRKTDRANLRSIAVAGLAALSILFFAFGLACPSFASTAPNASAVPGGYERWLGSVEGKEGTPSGGAILYDLRFRPDGTVSIEKSEGVHLVKDRANWTAGGDGSLRIEGGEGAIPEIDGALFAHPDHRHLTTKLARGPTLSLRPSIGWITWLHYAFFCVVVIFLGNELARRSKIAAYTLFLVFPVALLPLWLQSDFDTLFRWAKLYSAIIGAALFTLFRFNGLHRYNWVKILVAAVLAVNIAEAVSQDIASGALANLLNAAAGVLNILTIHRWLGIRRDDDAPHDMLWPGMTVGWIIAYDLWNITFVYLNFPNTVFFTAAIVIAPTIAALFVKKGTWLQARAYTLAIYMMYIFSFELLLNRGIGLDLSVPFPRSEGIALGAAIVSFGCNLGYALLHYRWRMTGRAPAHLQIGQSESVI